MPGKKLTIAQRRVLESFLDEFEMQSLHGSYVAFAHAATNGSFDGEASDAEIRVAKNLHAKGLLAECRPHGMPKEDKLLVKFTEAGARALWWVACHRLRDPEKSRTANAMEIKRPDLPQLEVRCESESKVQALAAVNGVAPAGVLVPAPDMARSM